MKRYLGILLLLLLCQPTSAQRRLTLRSCLERGLEQNYQVQIVRNEEQMAANDATPANAGMLPSVDLASNVGASLLSSDAKQRDGAKVNESASFDQSAGISVGVNWTIFEGMRLRTNLERLHQMKAMGEVQTRQTIEEFIASLTAEYYNFVQQNLRLENFRYAVQLSRERLRITEERFKIGSFSRLDLLQARVDFNADSSKYMSQHELVVASRIRINELMAEEDVNARISIRDTLISVNKALVWERLVQDMESRNAELLLAEHQTRVSELDLKMVKGAKYPYVTLSAGYGYNYNRFDKGAMKWKGALGPDVGIRIGVPLFNPRSRRDERNAQLQIDNSRLLQQQIRQTLMADLSTFWQAYRNNLELIELERENLIAAKENYEIAMERYLLGDLPGIEMREAQKNLLDAEERILAAQYNTKLCEISLQQISGNVSVYLQ